MLILTVVLLFMAGCLVVILLCGVGVFLLTLFSCYVERRAIPDLVPIDHDAVELSAKARKYCDEAEALGLLRFGVFRDARSEEHKHAMPIYLSPEGQVMCVVTTCPGIDVYVLYSPMADGVWLETQPDDIFPSDGPRFLSALSPKGVGMAELLRYQRDRADAYPAETLAFAPETLARDIEAQERGQTEADIERGAVAWCGPDQNRWRRTHRGAWRMAVRMTRDTFRIKELDELRKRYAPPKA